MMVTYPGGRSAVEWWSRVRATRFDGEGIHVVVGDDFQLHLHHQRKEEDMRHGRIRGRRPEGNAYQQNQGGGIVRWWCGKLKSSSFRRVFGEEVGSGCKRGLTHTRFAA
jgi:hypothetical protein